MKTAMQELIDYLKKDYYINELSNFDIDKIKFLEKEKEQIIDACNSAFEDKTTWGERYYNKTYNQNK